MSRIVVDETELQSDLCSALFAAEKCCGGCERERWGNVVSEETHRRRPGVARVRKALFYRPESIVDDRL